MIPRCLTAFILAFVFAFIGRGRREEMMAGGPGGPMDDERCKTTSSPPWVCNVNHDSGGLELGENHHALSTVHLGQSLRAHENAVRQKSSMNPMNKNKSS